MGAVPAAQRARLQAAARQVPRASTSTHLLLLSRLQLFVPLGKGHINVAANVVAFYVVAAPVVAAVALTDAVTTDVATKLGACVGLSSIAQVCASPNLPAPHTASYSHILHPA